MKPYPKHFDKIRVRPDPKTEVKSYAPICQWDGCKQLGMHKAPVGRMKEGEYFQFCFDHVREYNKGFNYFSSLADGDIARFQKEALAGCRLTWTMGSNAAASSNGAARSAPDFAQQRSGRAGYYNRMRDGSNVFGRQDAPRQRKAKPLETKALETLGLDAWATGTDIKTRYKELVKRHHPDANGGNRCSEERFRDVLHAYRVLKEAGLC